MTKWMPSSQIKWPKHTKPERVTSLFQLLSKNLIFFLFIDTSLSPFFVFLFTFTFLLLLLCLFWLLVFLFIFLFLFSKFYMRTISFLIWISFISYFLSLTAAILFASAAGAGAIFILSYFVFLIFFTIFCSLFIMYITNRIVCFAISITPPPNVIKIINSPQISQYYYNPSFCA